MDTAGSAYSRRLVEAESAWWKGVLDVQRPYRWNLRRHDLGRTLDIGCGIGRNLLALEQGSVGVDHNETSVQIARSRGLTAYTVGEFRDLQLQPFDSLLIAHVVEHMTASEAEDLLRSYLPHLRPGGKVLFVCPQERGYASDPTHVCWTNDNDLVELAHAVGLVAVAARSFPFPRWAGRLFTYNEFNVLAMLRAD